MFEPSNNMFGFESAQHGSNGIGRDYLNIHDEFFAPHQRNDLCRKRHLVQQEGRTVFKYALVKHMGEASQRSIDQTRIKP